MVNWKSGVLFSTIVIILVVVLPARQAAASGPGDGLEAGCKWHTRRRSNRVIRPDLGVSLRYIASPFYLVSAIRAQSPGSSVAVIERASAVRRGLGRCLRGPPIIGRSEKPLVYIS